MAVRRAALKWETPQTRNMSRSILSVVSLPVDFLPIGLERDFSRHLFSYCFRDHHHLLGRNGQSVFHPLHKHPSSNITNTGTIYYRCTDGRHGVHTSFHHSTGSWVVIIPEWKGTAWEYLWSLLFLFPHGKGSAGHCLFFRSLDLLLYEIGILGRALVGLGLWFWTLQTGTECLSLVIFLPQTAYT